MSEFELFKQALAQYKHITPENEKLNNNTDCDQCFHENIITDHGATVCIECGVEIDKKITQNKEWKYYGQGDTKHNSNGSRLQKRKTNIRNIFNDVENFNFSENIISTANRLYNEATNGNIYRGNSRKAIVFACVYHAFKLSGIPQPHMKLIDIFGINKHAGLKGLKFVNINTKTSSIRESHITPVNLVDEIMDQFNATEKQKNEVKELYEQVKNKSSKLNRSRPHSIASGIIYYWFRKTGKDISLKEFTKNIDLSELTVIKIAREVATVLKTPNIV